MTAAPAEPARRAVACSTFVREGLDRHPEWLAEADWLTPRPPGALRDVVRNALSATGTDDAALLRALRVLRRREMVRIAIRALGCAAPLDETLAELTEFAEACCGAAVEAAQRRLNERYGEPRDEAGGPAAPVVLGMGKLGGGELNFSSDIDLIFYHTAGGETGGPNPIDNGTYFLRMVQDVVRILSSHTEDGFVFRVDLMLRPFGSAGPLSMSFDAAEDYYQIHGREWERYALIKARPVAGDLAAGEALLLRLRPFVYRRYLDFNAIGSLRDLKRRIHDDVVARRVTDDVKLGPGGIREVEFVVQSFQLVRGGQDPRLRDPRLRPTLRYLGETGLLDPATARRLDDDYVFLRRLENAIQMYGDHQTHRLPSDEVARTAVAHALDFADWEALRTHANEVSHQVHREFRRVFAEPDREARTRGSHVVQAAFGKLPLEAVTAALAHAGFDVGDPGLAQRLMDLAHGRHTRELSESSGARLRHVVARVLDECLATSAPARSAERVLAVIHAVAGRSTYLALLDESHDARAQLVRLSAASRWLTDQIAASPAVLDTLIDPRTLYAPPGRAAMRTDLAARLAHVPVADVEHGMDTLRRYRNEVTVRIAAADVAGVLPVVKVSDHLTWLAEAVLDAALERAHQEIATQYGEVAAPAGGAARLAAIAYGKFGGIELGYGSDLDLVFVHEDVDADADSEGGARSLPGATYFARLAHRVIHWLATLTPAGRAYEVDLELRPSGASGLVCVSLTAFGRYQREHAWTWEHQALTRARCVAGPERFVASFDALRRDVLCRPRDPTVLRDDVLAMRARMRAHLDRPGTAQWDVKQGEGGMIDIEFITQYLLLRDAHDHPRLADWSDHWRQTDVLAEVGSLPPTDRDALIAAYRKYRACVHEQALQQAPGFVDADAFAAERADVSARWRAVFGL